jgi:hypothetical protein
MVFAHVPERDEHHDGEHAGGFERIPWGQRRRVKSHHPGEADQRHKTDHPGGESDVRELRGTFPEPTLAALDEAAQLLASIPDGALVLIDGLAFGGMSAGGTCRRLPLLHAETRDPRVARRHDQKSTCTPSLSQRALRMLVGRSHCGPYVVL